MKKLEIQVIVFMIMLIRSSETILSPMRYTGCIKQLVSINVSLWLKFKNKIFTEEVKNSEWIMNSNIEAENVIFEDEKLFT